MKEQKTIYTINNFSNIEKWTYILIAFIAFFIPFEHKYDKPLRHFSQKVIPSDISFACDFDKNIYFYASDLANILLICLLVFVFRIPLRKIFFEKGSFFLWILFLSALSSIAVSNFSHYLTVYTRLLQLLSPILLYIVIIQTPTTTSKIKNILLAIILAGLIQAGIGMAQYFTQKYLGLRLLSEFRGEAASFTMASQKLWLLDYLFDTNAASTNIRRAYGTLPHCNALGGFLSMAIFAIYPFFTNSIRSKKKALLALCILFLFFTLCLSFSRSAIFGFILTSICWFAWTIYKKQFHNFTILASTVVGCIVVCFTLLCEQFLERGGIVNYNQTSLASDLGRLEAQATAFAMIQENPITGIGFQQFSEKSVTVGSATGAHNIYLFLWSENGLIALLSFIGFAFYILYYAFKAPYSPFLTSFMAMFGCFLFIGLCDFYPILFQQGRLMLFLSAALIVAETTKIKYAHSKIIGFSCQN